MAFWIGINDIGDSAKLNVDFPVYYNEIISTMFEQSVLPVYKAGYKKFLFINLPPLNRSPNNLIRAAGPLPNITMIGWWDSSLDLHRLNFTEEYKDATAMLFDANTFLNHVLDNHTEYNIPNITSFCPEYNQPLPVTQYGCLPLDDYFWYDSGHL